MLSKSNSQSGATRLRSSLEQVKPIKFQNDITLQDQQNQRQSYAAQEGQSSSLVPIALTSIGGLSDHSKNSTTSNRIVIFQKHTSSYRSLNRFFSDGRSKTVESDEDVTISQQTKKQKKEQLLSFNQGSQDSNSKDAVIVVVSKPNTNEYSQEMYLRSLANIDNKDVFMLEQQQQFRPKQQNEVRFSLNSALNPGQLLERGNIGHFPKIKVPNADIQQHVIQVGESEEMIADYINLEENAIQKASSNSIQDTTKHYGTMASTRGNFTNDRKVSATITQRSGQFSNVSVTAAQQTYSKNMGKTSTASMVPSMIMNNLEEKRTFLSTQQKQRNHAQLQTTTPLSISFQPVFGSSMIDVAQRGMPSSSVERLDDGRPIMQNQTFIQQNYSNMFQQERSRTVEDSEQNSNKITATKQNQHKIQKSLPYINNPIKQQQYWRHKMKGAATSAARGSSFNGSMSSHDRITFEEQGKYSVKSIVPMKKINKKLLDFKKEQLQTSVAKKRAPLVTSGGEKIQSAKPDLELSIRENQLHDKLLVKQYPLRNLTRLNQDDPGARSVNDINSITVIQQQLEELKHFETLLDNQQLSSTDAYNDSFVEISNSVKPIIMGRNNSALPGAAKTYTQIPSAKESDGFGNYQTASESHQAFERLALQQPPYLPRKQSLQHQVAGKKRRDMTNKNAKKVRSIMTATRNQMKTRQHLRTQSEEEANLPIETKAYQVDFSQLQNYNQIKQKLRSLRLETTQLEDQAITLQHEYENTFDRLKMEENNNTRLSINQDFIRKYLDFLLKLVKNKAFDNVCDRFAKLMFSVAVHVDECFEHLQQTMKNGSSTFIDKITSLDMTIDDQNQQIQALKKELEEERSSKNVTLMGLKVRRTLEKLQSGMKEPLENDISFYQRSELEQIRPSEAGYELFQINQILVNASRSCMPFTTDDLMGSSAMTKLVKQARQGRSKVKADQSQQFQEFKNGPNYLNQSDAQNSLLTKVKDLLIKLKPRMQDAELQTDPVRFVKQKSTDPFCKEEETYGQDELDSDDEKDPKILHNKLKKKDQQLQNLNEKNQRLDAEVTETTLLCSKTEAFVQIKDDEIEDLKLKLKVFEYVDLERYRNLNRDNKVALKQLSRAQIELEQENNRSIARLDVCKEKDDQLVKMKLMMQRLMMNLMLDLQEVFDHLQTAKETMSRETEGFEEGNYAKTQNRTFTKAQRSLKEIRRVRIGQPFSKDQPYEKPGDTEFAISTMRKTQDELQQTLRTLSVSIGFNTGSFVKFLKKRIKLLKNSFKRQVENVRQILLQQETMKSEHSKTDQQNQNLINKLKLELKTTIQELRGQKTEYTHSKAQKRADSLEIEEYQMNCLLNPVPETQNADATNDQSEPQAVSPDPTVENINISELFKMSSWKPSKEIQQNTDLNHDRVKTMTQTTESDDVESLQSDGLEALVANTDDSTLLPSVVDQASSHTFTLAQPTMRMANMNETASSHLSQQPKKKKEFKVKQQDVNRMPRTADIALVKMDASRQSHSHDDSKTDSLPKLLGSLYRGESPDTIRQENVLNPQGMRVNVESGMRAMVDTVSDQKLELAQQTQYREKSWTPTRLCCEHCSAKKRQVYSRYAVSLASRKKIKKLDKAVQTYDKEVQRKMYRWKKDVTDSKVQTEDIIIERLAAEQYEFRKTQAYMRYFQYSRQTAQTPLLEEEFKRMIKELPMDENQKSNAVNQYSLMPNISFEKLQIHDQQSSCGTNRPIASTLGASEYNNHGNLTSSSPKKMPTKLSLVQALENSATSINKEESPSFLLRGSSFNNKITQPVSSSFEQHPYAISTHGTDFFQKMGSPVQSRQKILTAQTQQTPKQL